MRQADDLSLTVSGFDTLYLVGRARGHIGRYGTSSARAFWWNHDLLNYQDQSWTSVVRRMRTGLITPVDPLVILSLPDPVPARIYWEQQMRLWAKGQGNRTRVDIDTLGPDPGWISLIPATT